MKRQHPEQQLQKAVCQYLDAALPKGAWYTAFPAGGGGKLRGAILKGVGLKAGVPDILIIMCGRAHWIELKSASGRVTLEQQLCHSTLQEAGCYVGTAAHSVDEVEALLRSWSVPLRATVKA